MTVLCSNLYTVSRSPIQKPKSLQHCALSSPGLAHWLHHLPPCLTHILPILLLSCWHWMLQASSCLCWVNGLPGGTTERLGLTCNACQFSCGEEKLGIWPSNLPIGSFLWVFMSWPAQVVNYELASPSEVNHLLWCLSSLEGKPGHAHSSVRCYWRALSFLCPHYALSSCMMPASFSLSLICRSWWWCKGSQPCNQEMLWFIKNLESLGQSIITLLHLWKESESVSHSILSDSVRPQGL